MLTRKKITGSYITVSVILSLCTLIILYPFIYILAVSLSDSVSVMQNDVWLWPIGFNLDAYKKVASVNNFLNSYKNTFLYTLVGTAIALVVTTLTAYPLSKSYLKGRRFFNLMIVFTMMFSGGLVAGYLNIKELGIMNSIWAIVLPGCCSAYNMILMRTFFEQLPISMEESAKLDGASDMAILLKIILPLSTPIISTMVLFYAVGRWNSWFTEFIYLRDADKFPLQLIIRSVVLTGEMDMAAQGSSEIVTATSLKYSVVIVSMIPMLILYPLIQKYLVKGIMIGAVKG